MDCFAVLDGCVSSVPPSPWEESRLLVASPAFKLMKESETTWEGFLPSDYKEIISRSVSPVVYSSKKELYFRLCNNPILIDKGKMSFALDKMSGKKCYMLGASTLAIAWGDTPEYWKWTSHPDSRFSKVAELRRVCWLDIRGKVKTRSLSQKTTYAAYFVYKIAGNSRGLEGTPSKVSVRFARGGGGDGAEAEASTIYLTLAPSLYPQAGRQSDGQFARERNDGWMEIEMGKFFNDKGDDGEVEMRLMEIKKLNWKSGLIVQGIELRPEGAA